MRNRFPKLMGIALLLATITFFSYLHSKKISPAFESEENEIEESRNKLQNFRDAYLQEVEITKDPNTNTVPRERLLAAKEQVENYFADQSSTNSLAINGINWEERGPSNIGGRTRAIVFDKNDATNNTIIVGSVGGGIWKATNLSPAPPSQPTWTKLSDVLDNISISCIVQDASTPSILYAGTGETFGNTDAIRGLGIFKSTDGGSTWKQLLSTNNANFYYTQRIVVRANGHVFAATSNGIFKSTNGGTSWTLVLPGDFADLELAANNDLYASNFFGRVYKSLANDAGNYGTWSNISPSGAFKRIEMATAPTDNQKIYLLCEGPTSNNCDAIFRSDNGGTSWTSCTVPTIIDQGSNSNFTRGQAWYGLTCTVDPNNASTVIIGGIDALRSKDGGSTWQQITTWSLFGAAAFGKIVHADQHAIVFSPGSSSNAVWGTDGGIYYTSNVNVTVTNSVKPNFDPKNNGYNVTQFYGGAIHPTAGSNWMLAGAQDNGSQKFNSAGIAATSSASGGDGAFCHINQLNPVHQVTSYTRSTFYYSSDGGSTFSNPVNIATGPFINPTALDNSNNTLYAGYAAGQSLRWDITGTATKILAITNFNGATVTHVYISPNNPDRVYYGLDNGSVVYVDGASTGSGGTITKAGVVLKTGIGSVSGIAIEPGNESHVLVTYSNYGVTSVFETTNGGSTWGSIEGNLPDMPVRWMIFNPANANQALLATEVGVWTTSSLNGTNTDWTPTNGGLANVRVDMLKVRTSDNTIMAVTHGRGVFTTVLTNTVLPTIQFKENYAVFGETGSTGTTCGNSYRDVPVTMTISNTATADVTVNITTDASSTATNGQDYTLSATSLTFPSGTTTSQSFNIRIFDDANVEGPEVLKLDYTISAGGAVATKGTTYQSFQLDITDNDNNPSGTYTGLFSSGPNNATLGGSSPLQATQSDKKMQYLYRASELLANGMKAGAITSFNFSVSSKGSNVAYNGFTIKIAQTSATDLSAGFVSPAPTFTTVYTAPAGGFNPTMGENEFPITGFNWDGTSNILFEYCYDNSVLGTADDLLTGEQTSYNSQAKITSTTTSNAGCGFTTAATVNLFRPVIIFSQPVAATGVSSALNSTKQATIGPYETVSFYDASGNIIATVKNLDNWNYGCITIDIDRAGTSALPFWNNSSSNYVSEKTIRIIPTNDNPAGNIQVTMYFTAAEKAGWEAATGNLWANVGMVKVKYLRISDVTPSNPMASSVSIGSISNRGTLATNYSITGNFSTGFSGFAVGNVAAPVAVTGLKLTGMITNGHSVLSWSTLSENESHHFEVEKSDNGIFFHPIGNVAAAGHSSTARQYSFTDADIAQTLQYYRIKQVDVHSSFTYSSIINLQQSNDLVRVGPNPFTDRLNIQFGSFPNSKLLARLYDAQGKLVLQVAAVVNTSNWSIDVSRLSIASGLYTLQVINGEQETNVKILKR